MNFSKLPRIIQVCLSSSVAWLSFCVGLSALRSSEISIDTANAKISLSHKISATQQQLQSTLSELERTQLELQSLKNKRIATDNKNAIATLKPQIEESIEELDTINEELTK